MSSTDHPFVQAFARTRRNTGANASQRPSSDLAAQAPSSQAPSSQAPGSQAPGPLPNSLPKTDDSSGPPEPTHPEPTHVGPAIDSGDTGMTLDASVAETAQVWLEPVQNQFLRIDTPKPTSSASNPPAPLPSESQAHPLTADKSPLPTMPDVANPASDSPVGEARTLETPRNDPPVIDPIASLQTQVFAYGDFIETAAADSDAKTRADEPSLRIDPPQMRVAPPRNSIVQKSTGQESTGQESTGQESTGQESPEQESTEQKETPPSATSDDRSSADTAGPIAADSIDGDQPIVGSPIYGANAESADFIAARQQVESAEVASSSVETSAVDFDEVSSDAIEVTETAAASESLANWTASHEEATDLQEEAAAPVVAPPPEAVWPGAQWEVDVFDVPQSVASLFFDDAFFRSIAKRMRETVQDGLQSLAITSLRSGEGRSTVAIGTAIAAAATGLRVALVDCDAHAPTLVDDLRLELDQGWGEAIRHGVALNQIAVSSIEDGVTLFPLMPHAELVDPAEIVALMQSLQGRFDLIVVDAPLGGDTFLNTVCQTVDSAVIARDVRFTSQIEVNQLAEKLREAGVQGVGVVENFVG